MARPKKSQEGPSAQARLEEAWWQLLAQPADQLTVRNLCRLAGVNHNTLYYHFESLEDMAQKMFERTLTPNLAQKMLPILFGRNFFEGLSAVLPDLPLRFSHMCLMARSPLVAPRMRSFLVSAWLTGLGIRKESLSHTEELMFTFISNGVVGVLSAVDAKAGIQEVYALTETTLFAGLTGALRDIAKAHGTALPENG